MLGHGQSMFLFRFDKNRKINNRNIFNAIFYAKFTSNIDKIKRRLKVIPLGASLYFSTCMV